MATANSLDLPQALIDRMEIIQISGYTEHEKLQIAKQHLIAKQALSSPRLKAASAASAMHLRETIGIRL